MKILKKQIYFSLKKEIEIVLNDKILFLTLPLAFFILFFLKIIKKFIHIRFGLIHSDRIGHFSANTELFLLEEIYNKNQKKYFDLYYFPRKPCNLFLAELWKRKLKIFPKFLIRPFCLISRRLSIFEEFVCGKSIAGDMDSLNLYDKYDPILEFNKKDYKLARTFFEKYKI